MPQQIKETSTCVVRMERVDESSSLLLPAGWILPHCSGFFLGLWQHGVAPFKPHLAQEEVDAAGPHQEAHEEGPSGAGALHGDSVSSTVMSQLQHVYMGTQHTRINLMTDRNLIDWQKCFCIFLSSAKYHSLIDCIIRIKCMIFNGLSGVAHCFKDEYRRT